MSYSDEDIDKRTEEIQADIQKKIDVVIESGKHTNAMHQDFVNVLLMRKLAELELTIEFLINK